MKIIVYCKRDAPHLDETATRETLLNDTCLEPVITEFDAFITPENGYINCLDILEVKSHAAWIYRSLADVERFVELAYQVLNDPQEFCKQLLDLENTLSHEWSGLYLTPRNYIAGSPVLAPGLPDQGLAILDEALDFRLSHALLQEENTWGINLPDRPGEVAKLSVFSGFVDKHEANQHVKRRKTFIEDGQCERGLWHGIQVHRLQILVLLKAFKAKGFTFDDGSALNINNLLDLLIDAGMWGQLLDTNLTALRVRAGSKNACHGYISVPENYQPIFSGTGPSVLNSFLMCFGDQFGLPIVQSLLLKEHYYHTGLMFRRLELTNQELSSSIDEAGLRGAERVYYNMISALWFSSSGPNIYSGDYAFNVQRSSNSILIDRQYLAWATQGAGKDSINNDNATNRSAPAVHTERVLPSFERWWLSLSKIFMPDLMGKPVCRNY